MAYVKEFYGEEIPPSNTGSDICKIEKALITIRHTFGI
jgi:hypothetical protein